MTSSRERAGEKRQSVLKLTSWNFALARAKARPYEWYDTPNIRVGTYADFEVLARKEGLRVIDAFGIEAGRPVRRFPNLRASVALFKFERR